jgi:hypothetical protein
VPWLLLLLALGVAIDLRMRYANKRRKRREQVLADMTHTEPLTSLMGSTNATESTKEI